MQIARVLGAEVTGVCSGKNADLVRSLGAVVRAWTEGRPRGRGAQAGLSTRGTSGSREKVRWREYPAPTQRLRPLLLA